MRYPGKIHVNSLVTADKVDTRMEVNGRLKWVAARPKPYQSLKHRLKMTWAVFTGRADALFWDGQ